MNKEARYVTILDFDNGDYELILSDYGHNLSNCEWMVHDEPGITTENHREYIY